MKVAHALRIVAVSLACTLGSTMTLAASGGPEDTVSAFNAAFVAKDPEALVATLAEGGAQFTLRSQHDNASPDKIQSEIASYWTVIAPVLFASTTAYQRKVEILDSRVDGDIATVWTNTRTESTRVGETEPDLNAFTEVYLLVRTTNGWKIAGLADNRQATTLADD